MKTFIKVLAVVMLFTFVGISVAWLRMPRRDGIQPVPTAVSDESAPTHNHLDLPDDDFTYPVHTQTEEPNEDDEDEYDYSWGFDLPDDEDPDVYTATPTPTPYYGPIELPDDRF